MSGAADKPARRDFRHREARAVSGNRIGIEFVSGGYRLRAYFPITPGIIRNHWWAQKFC